jgi:hypothetical protein
MPRRILPVWKYGGGNNIKEEIFTLTPTDVMLKYVELSDVPVSPTNVLVFIKGAPIQSETDDYIMDPGHPTRLSWLGRGWDGILEENEELLVMYEF